MVRFKNRYVLVEFLNPSSGSTDIPVALRAPTAFDGDGDNDNGIDSGNECFSLPPAGAAFLYPSLNSSDGRVGLGLGDEGGQVIHRAIRGSVAEVFGDEGWGRIASSIKVIYHSPLTSITIIRVARQHIHTLHGGITLLDIAPPGQKDGRLVPRVIAISGTIKKCQNRAIAHHRWVVACLLGSVGEAEQEKMQASSKREEEAMSRVEG